MNGGEALMARAIRSNPSNPDPAWASIPGYLAAAMARSWRVSLAQVQLTS